MFEYYIEEKNNSLKKYEMTDLSQLRGFNMLLKRLKLSSSGTVDFVMTYISPSGTKIPISKVPSERPN